VSEGAPFLGHELDESQNGSSIWITGWRLFLTFYNLFWVWVTE
jgi:hypothetical protein